MSENKFILHIIAMVLFTFITLMGFCVLGAYLETYQNSKVAYIEHSDGTIEQVKIKFEQ